MATPLTFLWLKWGQYRDLPKFLLKEAFHDKWNVSSFWCPFNIYQNKKVGARLGQEIKKHGKTRKTQFLTSCGQLVFSELYLDRGLVIAGLRICNRAALILDTAATKEILMTGYIFGRCKKYGLHKGPLAT